MRYKDLIEKTANEIISYELSSGTASFNIQKLKDSISSKTIESIKTPDGIVDIKGDSKILTLSINDELVSGMIVDTNEYPYPAITFIYSNPSFRNKGYMKKLLKEYTKRFGKLMTDNVHSGDAESMWRSLIARKTSELKIDVINTSTDEISKYGDPEHPWSINPWDDTTGEIRLVFENREELFKKLMESKPLYDHDGALGYFLDNNI